MESAGLAGRNGPEEPTVAGERNRPAESVVGIGQKGPAGVVDGISGFGWQERCGGNGWESWRHPVRPGLALEALIARYL